MKRRALAAVAITLFAGCASTQPPAALLTLPSAVTAAPSPAAMEPGGPVLVVRRVQIPEYLQTRHVRYRAQASTLEEWPNTQWAERLEVGVTRELAAAVRAALPGWRICEASCAEGQAAFSLSLALRPLDFSRSRGELLAGARWSLSRLEPTPQVLAAEQQHLAIAAPNDTPQAYAQTVTEALQAVARTVADRVRALR